MSTYRGKYPNQIKGTSFTKGAGLWLQANDGTTVRLTSEAAWHVAQKLGTTTQGPQLGDDITPYLDWSKSVLVRVVDFGVSSAVGAFDQADAYGGLESSIASHRENVRDTLADDVEEPFETIAFAAYDRKVAELRAQLAERQALSAANTTLVLPPARAMYELLRDLVGAQEAARTTPAPGVMAVITSARLMIEATQAQRDRVGHDAVCLAASRALASPRLDGKNAAR